MKQKRYWLRGGIIGLILVSIVWISALIVFIFCFNDFKEPPSCHKVYFLNYTQYLFFLKYPFSNNVFYIGLGTILGWLYGKLKNRN